MEEELEAEMKAQEEEKAAAAAAKEEEKRLAAAFRVWNLHMASLPRSAAQSI